MARWSSGQDSGLSRRKREFDSPTGHQFFSKNVKFALDKWIKSEYNVGVLRET